MGTHPKESIALNTPPYVSMYAGLVEAARKCGYALAVHGSVARDFDLIAVPWIEDASPPDDLVEALRDACDGWIHAPKTKCNPTIKPHGRMTWSIYLNRPMSTKTVPAYIDLSIMPRKQK